MAKKVKTKPESESTATSGVQRDAKGRVVGGSGSLNPGGRPKAVKELLDVAREAVPRALEFARQLLDNRKANARVRLDAAKFLAAYGLGAPPRLPLDEDGVPNHSVLPEKVDEETLLFIARGGLRTALAAAATKSPDGQGGDDDDGAELPNSYESARSHDA